jgi:myo-inositol-1(or 4)-monophosphatase
LSKVLVMLEILKLPTADCVDARTILEIARGAFLYWPEIREKTDEQIELRLFEIIRAACPRATCFGEETSASFELSNDGISFLVDPIDGSHNRELGLPYFAISIAMYRYGHLVASLVFAPEWATIFVGFSGKSYRSTPFGVERMTVRALLPRTQRVIAMFKRELMDMSFSPEKIRTISCSSIEVCLVAKGALDGFIDHVGYEKQCDIAAALHILQGASGHFQYDCPVPPLNHADPEWLRPRRLLAVSQKEYLDEYSWPRRSD